jgi:polyisoprenoid-binding protein YceI
MRRLVALLLLATGSAWAQPVVYRLDPRHSFVHFEVMHFATSTIRARIGPVAGDVWLDRTAKTGSVSLRIPVVTVDTGAPFFNARLREADLLATAEYPEAYFVASDFRFDGDRLIEVRGEFTLRGVSRPIALHAQRFGCHVDPESKQEACGGDFQGELQRSQFGATYGLPFIADRVRLVVQVEGMRE